MLSHALSRNSLFSDIWTYFAVVSSILHSQDQFRSIGRQQVPVLSLVPLLSVQNLEDTSDDSQGNIQTIFYTHR